MKPIKYRVYIDGVDTGIWTWAYWADFIKFLGLMHNAEVANNVNNVGYSRDFDASYVWLDHERGDRYPTIKKYHYQRVHPNAVS